MNQIKYAHPIIGPYVDHVLALDAESRFDNLIDLPSKLWLAEIRKIGIPSRMNGNAKLRVLTTQRNVYESCSHLGPIKVSSHR